MSIVSGRQLLLSSAAAAAATGISRSLRFNSSDSASCARTFTSSGNRRTWTWAAWIKRSAISFSAEQHIWGVTGTTNATYGEMFFGTGDTLRFAVGYTTAYGITTTRVFRDPGAWFHVVLAFDATQSTAANKIKLYINGVEETTFSSDTRSSLANQDWGYNNNVAHYIGSNPNGDIRQFNGYLADIHFIDGQALTPSSFTEVSATTGQLIPKAYTGSFGTNGFWLPFSDNSNNTATTLGKDYSGNGNNWTPNNLSVTAGSGNDSLVDTPTSVSATDTGIGGEIRGNYCTWNPLDNAGTLANGNLDFSQASAAFRNVRSTFAVSSGKWYWEGTLSAIGGAAYIGIGKSTADLTVNIGGTDTWGYVNDGKKQSGNTAAVSYGASYTTGDVIGVAFDADNGTLTFYKNGTSQGQAYSGLTSGPYFMMVTGYNGTTWAANFGARAFSSTAPSGFKALCDTNLPAPVIAKPSTVMDVKLYTGNGSTQTISGLGFSPDLVWVKCRSTAFDHRLSDTVRGTGKVLRTPITNVGTEETDYGQVTAFNSDGFTVGAGTNSSVIGINNSSDTFVSWCWDAGTSTVTNTQGSITSSVRANTSAGFSIVTFTSNASGNATVGHGLGVAPSLVILKNRTGGAGNWLVFHKAVCTKDNFLYLNSTNALGTYTDVQGAAIPSSTVFGINAGIGIAGSADCVAYCFAPVTGYSSMGSYVGNGSSDGPFVYTGFRPRWILVKSTSTTGWAILDAARNAYNLANGQLFPHASDAELTSPDYFTADFLSNGFKLRTTNSASNTNAQAYIYAAFAESPFQYARAR